jgi:hypothetical protein
MGESIWRGRMEAEIYVKDTPMLWLFGILFLSIFGLWLRKRFIAFNFSKKYSMFLFLLDNLELVGGVLVGVLLILAPFLA